MSIAIIVILVCAVAALVCMALEYRAANQEQADTQPTNWRLFEYWENYPTPDYSALHTYCKVRLKGSGKLVYYRTRNPELQKGDMVFVPVGRRYEKKVGKIVSMRRCRGYFAPQPLEKTKYIIDKIPPRKSCA